MMQWYYKWQYNRHLNWYLEAATSEYTLRNHARFDALEAKVHYYLSKIK